METSIQNYTITFIIPQGDYQLQNLQNLIGWEGVGDISPGAIHTIASIITVAHCIFRLKTFQS